MDVIVEGTVRIGAPPERVFEYMVDPTHWVEYDPTLVEVTPSDRLRVGSSGIVRNRRAPGMTAKASWRTTKLEPPVRVTQELRGMGYELTEDVRLTPIASGTELHIVETLLPTSLVGRVFVAMSRGFMERDLRARSQRLKTVLEGKPREG